MLAVPARADLPIRRLGPLEAAVVAAGVPVPHEAVLAIDVIDHAAPGLPSTNDSMPPTVAVTPAALNNFKNGLRSSVLIVASFSQDLSLKRNHQGAGQRVD